MRPTGVIVTPALFGLVCHPCGAWRRFCCDTARHPFGHPLLGANVTWMERG